MEAEKILVVDDNKEIVYSISELLKYEGYEILKAYDGMEALDIMERENVDLILLDVMMPRLNGLSALMKLREKSRIPVIILSAKTEESDKVSGLTLGADDYIEKPYNPAELIARVKAHLRRYRAWSGGETEKKKDPDQIVNGGLVLDKKQRVIFVEGEEVHLTATEYKILELLMAHPGQVFPAEQIYENVWQETADYTVENTVMVHIRHIREKVEIDAKKPRYVKVVWGIGYKMEKYGKAIKKFIKEYYDCVFGALMFIIGSFLFFVMLVNRYYFSTWGVWRICLIGNILVQPGICLLVRRYMKLRYRNWSQKGSAETYLQDTEDSIYYQTWKAKEKQSEKRFRNILAVELSAAAAYLFFISYSSGWGWNYAAGYMMVATVFIEYICCREVIQRYWRNELDQIMEQTESFFQKRLEQALEIERKSLEKVSRSDQLRVDLITNVSHDLKTPLTSIVGYLELIKKEELRDVVRDYVDVISTRAGKLGEMINSLFSLAKASSGNVELHKETFELNRLMEQIFADMDDRIKESGLKFVTQFTEEDTAIYSDNSYFYRICQNLIENALKYSAKGTRVFVKTYKKEAGTDQKMVLEITNTSGYEMDFEKEDIIERFSRGDKARTSEGNGLGLAIVSTYAKALGGEFDIKIDCDQFKAIVSI